MKGVASEGGSFLIYEATLIISHTYHKCGNTFNLRSHTYPNCRLATPPTNFIRPRVDTCFTLKSRFQILDSRVQNPESRVQNLESRVQNLESRIQILYSRFQRSRVIFLEQPVLTRSDAGLEERGALTISSLRQHQQDSYSVVFSTT